MTNEIGLHDLARQDVGSWEEAERGFAFPRVGRYNIAADCLGHDPAKTALVLVDPDGTSAVTFGELDERSGRFGAGLRALGVEVGDRVAVKLSQSAEMAIVLLGALRIGAVIVPVSNVLGEDGVHHRLLDCDARALVARGSEQEIAIASRLGIQLVSAQVDGPAPTVQDLIAESAVSDFEPTGPDSPAIILYTSGTTGKPKGVLHGHRVILGHHPIDYAWNFVRADDISYSPVDWAWAGGLFLGLLVPLAHGASVVVFREQRFDPDRALEVFRECGVTIGLFPPTVLRMLRQSGAVTPQTAATLKLRCFITGAEAVEPELFAWAAENLGVTVNNAYGLTESNCLIGHSTVLGALDPECLGRPYPGRKLALLGEDGRPVGPGELGEIAVSADDPIVMIGYWNDPAATAHKLRDGWLRTGDTAHADEDGNLYFHGRNDDIIKSGAYRIGPAEIEAVILQHAAVAECGVVGLPDPVRGQIVTAAVKLREPHEDSERLTEIFQAEVRKKVGAHAYPRVVRYVDALPRTTNGKLDRKTLRAELAPAENP